MVKIVLSENTGAWDDYVRAHPTANLYHTFRWQNVIKKTYGHRVYYLMATIAQRAEGIAHRAKELEKGGSGEVGERKRVGGYEGERVGNEDRMLGSGEVDKWGKGEELKTGDAGSCKLKAQSTELNQPSQHNQPNLSSLISADQRSRLNRDQLNSPNTQPTTTNNPRVSARSIQLTTNIGEADPAKPVGILPLVHIKHPLFGNSLISMPYFDMGGILADNEETERALLTEAVKIAQKLKVKNVELRHTVPLSWLNADPQLKAESSNKNIAANSSNALNSAAKRQQTTDKKQLYPAKPANSINSINWTTLSSKVRMLLELPGSADELMRSFKAKLRSQIKKTIKEGLTAKIGSLDLLDDFYKVFTVNMRDLGSPVHSKGLIQNVLAEFPDEARLVLICKDQEPVAGSVIIGFKDHLQNTWSSALRKYSRLSPNMLLYWAMLEYACNQGFRYFDFGRSTPGEGTYKFKEQWGAKPQPLNWISISLIGEKAKDSIAEDSKFQMASEVWKKLPVPVANLIGPRIRKYIGL